jgi:predicted metalloprotease with PDZ domain
MFHALAHKALQLIPLAVALCASTPAGAQQNIPAPRDMPYPGLIRLQVDATDLDHRVFHVKQQLPVRPGRLSLLFPRFLPGTHGPYGQVERLAGLKVLAAAKPLPWVRDTVDPHAFHVDVAPGITELELQFQYLSALDKNSGRVVMTREMLNLQWNSVLLYPAGHHASAIQVQASVSLPPGWSQASALRVAREGGAQIEFQAVSLETLVDSPLFAGAHARRIELDPPGTPNPVALNLLADDAALLQPGEVQLQAHRNLVQQADRLFGSRHFKQYDFLLGVSDKLGGIGLEHHESSENGVRTSYFKDWAKRVGERELLPHEYVHSWNGKFRRPADLWTPNFNVPMRNSLLWVYEGQTQFWGRVLAARSGLVTAEQARDGLAQVAASFEYRAGRTWRNLQDTTNEGTIGARGRNKDWGNWQRGVDYYDEATLIWLDADMLIRERSQGAKSMDDFAQAFFGVQDGRVQPLTYTFEDVLGTLNQVLPFDWRGFLRERLDTHQTGAPLDGLKRSGWQLAWAEAPSEFEKNDDAEWRGDDFAYSLGLYLKRDGQVDSVLWDSPAYRAGLSKALKLIAVNGVAYKGDRLTAAVSANKTGAAPLELLVKEGDHYRTLRIDYRGGLRYPRLERVAEAPERLDAGLLAPRP